MNNFRIMVVTEEHVEDGAVFEVDEKNARDYIKAGKAHDAKDPKPEPKKEDLEPEKPPVKKAAKKAESKK